MKERFDALVEHLIKANIFLPEAIEILERSMIQRALDEHGGNQSSTSKQLGIHRNTLQRKITEYHLANGRVRRTRRKAATREGRSRPRKSVVVA